VCIGVDYFTAIKNNDPPRMAVMKLKCGLVKASIEAKLVVPSLLRARLS
jgi:hypothetical protein